LPGNEHRFDGALPEVLTPFAQGTGKIVARLDRRVEGFKHGNNRFWGRGAHLTEAVTVDGLEVVESREILQQVGSHHVSRIKNSLAKHRADYSAAGR
jgi:hypothetical protein